MPTIVANRRDTSALDYVFLWLVVALGVASLYVFAMYPQTFQTSEATSILAGP